MCVRACVCVRVSERGGERERTDTSTPAQSIGFDLGYSSAQTGLPTLGVFDSRRSTKFKVNLFTAATL